jgi:hypothetical protein
MERACDFTDWEIRCRHIDHAVTIALANGLAVPDIRHALTFALTGRVGRVDNIHAAMVCGLAWSPINEQGVDWVERNTPTKERTAFFADHLGLHELAGRIRS